LKGEEGISFLSAETVTAGGLQRVELMPESDLSKLLRKIAFSKVNWEG
jgi:hypothetical protein